MNMKPTYTHTCPKCRFLGATWKPGTAQAEDDRVIDWYVCEGQDPSVIGRSSSHQSDYWSSPRGMVTPEWCMQESVDPATGDRALAQWRIIALFMLTNGG